MSDSISAPDSRSASRFTATGLLSGLALSVIAATGVTVFYGRSTPEIPAGSRSRCLQVANEARRMGG
jgi:hypothetical protein